MYVKQWQMASDIRAIRNHFIKANEPKNITAPLSEETDYDKRLDNVKPGDKVTMFANANAMTTVGRRSLEALRLQPLGKPPQCFS